MAARLSAVRHTFAAPLVPGRLIRRYKRFLADVELADGRQVIAHCPNSGSMLGCMEPGAPVFLSQNSDAKRRTAYTWQMIFINQGWVGINTLVPNHLVAQAARKQALPLFQGAGEVRPEVKTSEHTRLDLLVERGQGPLYVEVKNVTLVADGAAIFPDAKTTRGAKHLIELMRLKSQGAGAAVVFVVQRMDAGAFAPAREIDPDYAALLVEARRKGVKAVVVQAKVSPREIHLLRELPLNF